MAIVVQNWYFITAGREAEALEIRRDASRVRREAGRLHGRILIPTEYGNGIPNFIWECDYADDAHRLADAEWVDASPEFTAVRARMAQCIDRFERIVFELE